MHDLIKLFVAFLKVGLFGYGGGPALIPLIQEEVVDVNHWLTTEEFTDALALGNSLPGPIAVKLSVFVGYKVAGISGALVGLTGISFPGALGILFLATLFFKYKDNPQLQGAFKAIRPVVIAMLAAVVYTLFSSSVTSWKGALIMGLSFVLIVFVDIHPAIIIVAAGIVGTLLF